MRAHGLEREVSELHKRLAGVRVERRLTEAEQFYTVAIKEMADGNAASAWRNFERAQISDFIVPRIKPEFSEALERIGREHNVAVISKSIPGDDREYFIDYCHPIEPANRMLAEEILNIIK